jgi:hypothetical protein
MRCKKKGAIELSMSTIIIVVIGIALLVVGFAFLDNIKEMLDLSTEGIGNEIKSKITGIEDLDRPVTISPDRVTLERGKGNTITVHFYNMGTTDAIFIPEVSPSATGDLKSSGVRCEILNSESTTLKSGETTEFKLVVIDAATALTGADKYGCTVKAIGDSLGLSTAKDTLSISVE